MTGSLKMCTFIPDIIFPLFIGLDSSCQALFKSPWIVQNGRIFMKLCSVVLTKSILLTSELKKLVLR